MHPVNCRRLWERVEGCPQAASRLLAVIVGEMRHIPFGRELMVYSATDVLDRQTALTLQVGLHVVRVDL